MIASSRDCDDALLSKGLNLLGQQLLLQVAVAQLAPVSTAPAPNGAVSGEGDAVVVSCRYGDDAPPSQCLDLLGQQLVLLVAVAQLAVVSIAPAPDSAGGGGGGGEQTSRENIFSKRNICNAGKRNPRPHLRHLSRNW